jgi:hypothetical protein
MKARLITLTATFAVVIAALAPVAEAGRGFP